MCMFLRMQGEVYSCAFQLVLLQVLRFYIAQVASNDTISYTCYFSIIYIILQYLLILELAFMFIFKDFI